MCPQGLKTSLGYLSRRSRFRIDLWSPLRELSSSSVSLSVRGLDPIKLTYSTRRLDGRLS